MTIRRPECDELDIFNQVEKERKKKKEKKKKLWTSWRKEIGKSHYVVAEEEEREGLGLPLLSSKGLRWVWVKTLSWALGL